MEIIDNNKIPVGTDLGPVNEGGGGGGCGYGGDTVVVANTVVEKEKEGYFGNLVNDDEGMKVNDSLKNQEGEVNEVVGNEKEGLFGNLVDGDEGMKVNSGENGTSLVMDVNDFFTGENGSEANLDFHGNENAGEDPMDVCISLEKEKNDCSRLNSGIKEGVVVAKGNTIRVLMDRLQPVELVSSLKDSARMEPGTRLFELELTVLKSCLSCFYRLRGGYSLVEYHDSKCIEGLEDKSKSVTVSDSDLNGRLENGDDKLYQKRKKKSVAELLEEDEPKIKKVKMSKDKRERKRKPLVVSVTAESDHESGGFEEGTMSPRQRKKSKYLSPPYLSPVGNGKLSGSVSFKEPKTESEMAEQLEESFKTNSGKKSRSQHRRLRERSDSKEDDKKMIDVAVDVNKVLHGLLRAALDPTAFAEKNLPAITDFVSSFRRSIFEEGSTYPSSDRKKDSSPTTLVIEFPSDATLPTKAELLKTYKKFADLIKKETHIERSGAFVVFGNSSDAEAAFAMSLEKKPFGDVKYHVREEAVLSVKTSSRKVVVEDTPGLEFIVQKLGTMREMVQRCEESQMRADVKASLEEGIKEVLDKVGNMRAK